LFSYAALILCGKLSCNLFTIDEAIGKLPKGYRQMLILHDVCGYEHEEIAKMLDCAAGVSKSQLFKARRKLRKLLSGETGNANLKSTL